MRNASAGVSRAGLLHLAQGQAIHKFHDEVGQVARLAEFVDGHDVGMVQPGQRAGFAIEALGEIRSGGGLRREDFQRDDPVQGGLAGLVDGAHAAFADEVEDLQLRK